MSRRVVAVLAAMCLALAGCSKATSGDQDENGVKTDVGVTDTTIKLGAMVDLTAVFAPLAKSVVQGIDLYWQQQNDAGGVCGRTVEVVVRDHAYDPQKAVSIYGELSGEVLGWQAILGSPVMSALLPSIDEDNTFAAFVGWSGSVLGDEHIYLAGTTYAIEAITGLDFLMRTKGIQAGDKIGHVYFEGDFGENALEGTKYLAEQAGLTIVEQKIRPPDTDLSAQVATLQNEGVKAIVVSAGPTQVASVAGVAKSVGLDVPIVSNGPGFTPQLLDTPVGDALVENLYVVSSIAPPSLDTPAAVQLQEAFAAANPDSPPTQVGSVFAYVQALITKEALQKACDNGDLTRQGVIDALHQLSALDTGGLVAGTLDYTDPANPPSRSVYISQPDRSVPGGLSAIEGPVEADAAMNYQPAG